MLTAPENYKGIKFVRISNLSSEEKDVIWKTVNSDHIIKILKEDALMNDCMQYKHYVSWYENAFNRSSKKLEHSESHHLAIAS